MSKTLSIITHKVNSASIRKETRDGREVLIVPSKTLPKDIVMNGILYPADEVKKSFKTLDKTIAPFGHPKVNGKHVLAADPRGLNTCYIGAYNDNVVYENDRVSLDKVIDIQVANQSENGRAVLAAIEKNEPIHTSTGVLLEFETLDTPITNSDGKTYSKVAKNMLFDHDCFLLNEPGAATPADGVGIFVNSNGDELSVINNTIDEAYDEEINWAIKRLADAVQAKENAAKQGGIVEKIKMLFSSILSTEASGLANNHDNEETEMSVKQEDFDALVKKVDNLATNAETIATSLNDLVANAMKPVTDALAVFTANAKAAEDAERATLTAKVVANKLLSEETAKTLSVNALRELAEKSAPGVAAPLLGGFQLNAEDEGFKEYNPNAAIDEAMKGAH